MALILNIETATTNCSVSLSNNGKVIALKETSEGGYSHGEKLHGFIHAVFKVAGISQSQIDAIAVSKGPGSYTGLRIGVSAAKGLCYALNKPLISVSTLEAVARQVKTPKGPIIAMLDARRLEVYAAVFDSSYQQIREVKAEVLSPDIYKEYLSHEHALTIIGNSVTKTEDVLVTNEKQVDFIETLPSAREMASISELKYQKSDVEDVAYFEPYYLKDFIAIKPKPLF